jgi:uncharacterized protein
MFNNPSLSQAQTAVQPRVEIRPLLRQVYTWMTLAMLVTAGSSLVISQVLTVEFLVTNPFIILGAVIGQFALVLALSFGIRRFSVNVAKTLFFVYAATVGITISLILAFYNGSTVVAAFGTTAGLFFVMTMMGLTTQMDLTKWGTYLLVGVIGLIIAMIVNMFLQSSAFEMIISFIGVVIFTALTAYDTQKLKMMAADPQIEAQGDQLMAKLSILGALTLYLDFLNLFLFLLRLLGGRD